MISGCPGKGSGPADMLWLAATILILTCQFSSTAAESGATVPPEKFSDDYYKVYGTPDLTVSLDSSRLYQGEKSSLFLTLANQGRVTSFQVNEEPGANKREEMIAAQKEQELEKLRTTAQDVSVRLRAENESAIDIARSVAYPGNIREGQTSARLEFPIEAYENAAPGQYRVYAELNYTYQRDVSVKGDEDRPESPDVFYWYQPLSQTVPLILSVQRHSLAEFAILNTLPETLSAGSEDNVVKISIKNVGSEAAKDLVARLVPESGIYVAVDESPIPILEPREQAELIYKLDVSKDAVPGKKYRLTVNFEFSDRFRDHLTDSENVYLGIEQDGVVVSAAWALLLFLLMAGLVIAIKNKDNILSKIHGRN